MLYCYKRIYPIYKSNQSVEITTKPLNVRSNFPFLHNNIRPPPVYRPFSLPIGCWFSQWRCPPHHRINRQTVHNFDFSSWSKWSVVWKWILQTWKWTFCRILAPLVSPPPSQFSNFWQRSTNSWLTLLSPTILAVGSSLCSHISSSLLLHTDLTSSSPVDQDSLYYTKSSSSSFFETSSWSSCSRDTSLTSTLGMDTPSLTLPACHDHGAGGGSIL